MTALDRTAAGCLGLLSIATIAYLWAPDAALLTWYNVVAVGAIALAFAGVVRHRPVRKTGWLLLIGGFGCWVLGDLIWTVESSVMGWEFYPLPSDAVYLGSYAVLGAGVLLLVRTRERRGGDLSALLDALIVATGAAVLAGVFVVTPLTGDSTLTLAGKLVSSAYPIADVLLLAILVRLYATPGARTRSFQLLMSALLFTLAGDVAWNVTLILSGDTSSYRWTDMLWMASYVAVAAAAWTPSMRGLAEPPPRREATPVTRRRLAILTAGLMLPAVALLLDGLGGGRVAWALIGLGSLAISGLVLLRMAGLLGTVQVQAIQLAALARADSLTGAPNRRTWDHELSRACQHSRETGEPLSVALLDLDRFKAYNDSRGHQAGDLLLREAVAAWTSFLGDEAFLARYGGEEFSLLLPGTTAEEARVVVDALRAVTPGDQTFSAGVATWSPETEPGAAVAQADEAMYEAKRSGRDRVVVASSGDPKALPTLRVALQPIVDLGSGREIAVEALSRFEGREPMDVFEEAHRRGTGPALEASAIRAALVHHRGDRLIGVNVSLPALLTAEVFAVLPTDLTGVVLEVTEHAEALADPRLAGLVAELRARGARIALDDWGRGFSNSERMLALQPEIIKLDMSLVRGLDSPYHQTVVRAMIAWADEAGVMVCAEGVETEAQWRLLTELGVHVGQGYFFGRPQVPQSVTTTNDAAVAEITGRSDQPGGVIGSSSGAETRTTIRSAVASTE